MNTGQGNQRGLDRAPQTPDSGAWDRLGRLVRERRAELGLTQAEIQSVGGPSPATLYQLEGGLRSSYRPHILRRLERALGWGSGSVRRILAGGLPQLEGEADTGPPLGEERTGGVTDPDSQEWMAGFRQLAIDPRDKLVLLSSLLEETIAELGPGTSGGPWPEGGAAIGKGKSSGLSVAPPPFS